LSKKGAKKRPPEMGRPTKRTKQIEETIHKALSVGCSLDNSAWMAGIDPETLRRWRREDPTFAGSCEKARSGATYKVASGLFRRATEEDDNTCAIFYLKTRAPEFRENKAAETDQPIESDVDVWRAMLAAIPGRNLPDES
jgi:hypothetical protein